MRNTSFTLTSKQLCLVEEYLVDFNGLAAAVRAGYGEKSSGAIASETLSWSYAHLLEAIAAGRSMAAH